MAANSSPPRRATLSDGRSVCSSRCPTTLQQAVADLVAEVVVHGLEPVEVEVEHREVRLVTADARERGLESVEQQHAVGQPGERVVQRAVAEVRLLAPSAR